MPELYDAPSDDPPKARPVKATSAKDRTDKLKRYWREIERYRRAASDWHEQAEKIVKIYLDEHRTATAPRRMAMFWSNIETLKPAVYAKLPTVLCSRRWKDADPTGRTAAEVMERTTNVTFELHGVHDVLGHVRDDRLTAGRGAAWVLYKSESEQVTDGEDEDGKSVNRTRVRQYGKGKGYYEYACAEYVHYGDFGHNVARVWADVWLVFRRVFMDREEVEARFHDFDATQLNYTAKSDGDDEKEVRSKAVIYECWDKRKRQTVWLAEELTDVIEEGDPPLDFRDFFPCPAPCYASKLSKSLIPKPDYRYYQDQLDEIDDLTEKIMGLTNWLRVKAFVPAGPSSEGADAIMAMLTAIQDQCMKGDSVFVPVGSWQAWSEKGGAGKLVDWLPIHEVVGALKAAIEARNQLIQDVYQITGISDILRGETDPNETLGAQELKAQTGSRRIRTAKDDVARFARDLGALIAEVNAEKLEPETLAAMSGIAYVPMAPQPNAIQPAMLALGGGRRMPGMPQQAPMLNDGMGLQMQQPGMGGGVGGPSPMPPLAGQSQAAASPSGMTFDDNVLALLRDDRMRGFRIDIETDSTIQPDEDAEKQRRTEFVTAVGTILEKAAPLLQMAPELAPLVGEVLKFTARGFRTGRNLEDVIEHTMDALTQRLSQPQQQAPDPAMVKAENDAKIAAATLQQEGQIKAAELQQQGALAAQKQQADAAQAAENARLKAQADAQRNLNGGGAA